MDLNSLAEVVRPLWLVLLVAVFGGIVFWVYRPKNQKRFEDAAQIPLKDDDGG